MLFDEHVKIFLFFSVLFVFLLLSVRVVIVSEVLADTADTFTGRNGED